jgi:hypothetical protein
MIGIVSCKVSNSAGEEMLEKSFFSLLGGGQVNKGLEMVEITRYGERQLFHMGSEMDTLHKCLHSMLVSGSSEIVLKGGDLVKRIGTIRLWGNGATVEYEIFSTHNPDLICIKVPLFRDNAGVTLLYFLTNKCELLKDNSNHSKGSASGG